MKENWLEIYNILCDCIKNKILESAYQREVEYCFRRLGWKGLNNTLQHQFKIPIGSKNSIRPDIVLQKENENGHYVPVVAIEIKRPDNIKSERQELQLLSYMRQLRINYGLYIGEKIQLFYDIHDSQETPMAIPVSVLNINIEENDKNGEVFCDLFNYDNFNVEKLETFCKESFRKRQEYIRLKDRMQDLLSEPDKNIKELIRNSLLTDGFPINEIKNVLSKISIQIITEDYHKNTNISQQAQDDYKTVQSVNSGASPIRDLTRFSFDGGKHFLNKRKFVLEVIKHYISTHPNISFEELEKVFYPEIYNRSRGVIKRLSDVEKMIDISADIRIRYFMNDILTLDDGTKIVVNNQWGGRFPNFLQAIKDIYEVSSNDVNR